MVHTRAYEKVDLMDAQMVVESAVKKDCSGLKKAGQMDCSGLR